MWISYVFLLKCSNMSSLTAYFNIRTQSFQLEKSHYLVIALIVKFFSSLPWDFLHCLIGIFIWKRLLGPLTTRVAVFLCPFGFSRARLGLRKHKPIFDFYLISSLDIEEGAGSWNPSLWMTRGQLSYIVNNMTADYLAIWGMREHDIGLFF